MPKTYNPRKARPHHTNRFRGVTSALIQSSVPKELSVTQHNFISNEIRQLKTRRGLDRFINSVVKNPAVFDGSIHERYYGLEVEALAEGTRVWAGELFPFPTGPSGDLTFTPDFPWFNPPAWPPRNDWPPGVEFPDLPDFDWPGLPPFVDTPLSPPPPYQPDPDDDPDQPDGPYGPDEPPGFEDPNSPCGWVVENITRKFNVNVSVSQWKLVKQQLGPVVNNQQCIENFCSPGALDCANYDESTGGPAPFARDLAQAAAILAVIQNQSLGAFETIPGEISSLCTNIDWTLESEQTTSIVFSNSIVCLNPEHPTGTILPFDAVTFTNSESNIRVYINLTVASYVSLVQAGNYCKQPKIELEWENGYKKSIPVTDSLKVSFNGLDMVIEDFDLGEINDLKTKTGYPTFLPCDLKPSNAKIVCNIPAVIWDCDGLPPPPLRFNTVP